MEGYGVDINSPEPPFVLFKVLFRIMNESFLGNLFQPIYYLFSILIRILSSILGYLAGFMFGSDDEASLGKNGNGMANGPSGPPVSHDGRIPRPKWAPDLSMMNDEYL